MSKFAFLNLWLYIYDDAVNFIFYMSDIIEFL